MKTQGQGGLIKAGELPAVKTLVKKFRPPTQAQLELAEAAAAIREQPDAVERAYMARQLVQCTLPHTDPGNVEQWARHNGSVTLGITPGRDFQHNRSLGYPYGVIPRLLLFWITTEAVKKKDRRLILGRSLSQFMREVGLNPRGGGKRSDSKRLHEQMTRLFASRITFQVTTEEHEARSLSWLNMEIAPEGELWWHPKHPDQGALWESWIELGEKFFNAVIAAPVPVDMRALKALKRSPLALDLYAWVTYRTFGIVQKNQPPKFISWQSLMEQFGTDYKDPKDFKKKAQGALRKIANFYPGLNVNSAKGGFTIHATRLAVPQKHNRLDTP